MEHAKKMLLIEPSLLEKINQSTHSDTPTSRLDIEMKNILDSNMDDRKKMIYIYKYYKDTYASMRKTEDLLNYQ